MNLTAEHILVVLNSQKFADWFNSGNYDKWISGDENAPTKEDILREISWMFKLEID